MNHKLSFPNEQAGVKRVLAGIAICLIGLIVLVLICQFKRSINNTSRDRVLLQRTVAIGNFPFREVFIMDGSGNNIQWIGYVTGALGISPNGQRIAGGCPPSNLNDPEAYSTIHEICIFETAKIPNYRQLDSFPFDYRNLIVSRINLPDQCKGLSLASISWAPDNNTLAAVCAQPTGQSDICIVRQNGEVACWSKPDLEIVIKRVAWSPVEDLIAVSDNSGADAKIFLMKPDGSDATYLASGWGAAWSPNGESLAYIRYEIMEQQSSPEQNGVAIVNKDGKNMKWLYQTSTLQKSEYPIMLDSCVGACQLSWSSDGKYLIFVGSRLATYSYSLFRMDIETKNIDVLLDPGLIGNSILEPSWVP